ncbi:MAG: ATP-binding protein [Lachnospiraceae bacterium]
MKTIKIPAALKELDNVRAFADEVLTDTVASEEDRMAIELAIEEVFVNIVKYSHLPETAAVMVSYEYDALKKAVVIQFEDEGHPFNPLEVREPDVTAELSERAPGGLGIYMLRKLMDYVEYEYVEDTNKLLICKKLTG